jgi:hypothetical protein
VVIMIELGIIVLRQGMLWCSWRGIFGEKNKTCKVIFSYKEIQAMRLKPVVRSHKIVESIHIVNCIFYFLDNTVVL